MWVVAWAGRWVMGCALGLVLALGVGLDDGMVEVWVSLLIGSVANQWSSWRTGRELIEQSHFAAYRIPQQQPYRKGRLLVLM